MEIAVIWLLVAVSGGFLMAFAHGSNDVANAISPIIGVFLVFQSGLVPTDDMIAAYGGAPLWILVLGGFGLALGIKLLGGKVILTLSERLTKINNSRGFCVDCATASTIVTASLLGIPVSSTHAATGSVVGSGLADHLPVDWRIFIEIMLAWLVTVPLAALLAIGFYASFTSLFTI